ncbi:hypothetical protein EVAR_87125_1 [Eumeta japonica]|uniref:Uncharacterized protein n=1 Tax=Eumeta variegata TaxID=151549 RepID=A0A4C1VXB2_EUMVA|nr:hypothetical protein EVAR_87125_1 [Eumeta japonica]
MDPQWIPSFRVSKDSPTPNRDVDTDPVFVPIPRSAVGHGPGLFLSRISGLAFVSDNPIWIRRPAVARTRCPTEKRAEIDGGRREGRKGDVLSPHNRAR